jgi:hypothetical protein
VQFAGFEHHDLDALAYARWLLAAGNERTG